MEFQSPPLSARRNPPRRAKAALPSPASHSERKRANLSCRENDSVEVSETVSDKAEVRNEIQAENEEVKNVQVFLRIRPAKLKEIRRSVIGIPKGPLQKRKTQILQREEVLAKTEHICLHANDSHSVTLTPPPSLLESKRTKTEVYNGFSRVFLPDSSQADVYENIMQPLIKDFVEGKSCLLVAMGPTSSGKTHTMFGNLKEPGLIPRALRNLLAPEEENDLRISRNYFISMFEIYSERGRGEKIIDLFQDGAELNLQQSNIKGLQEVAVSSVEEGESFLTQGMQKRTTAATNANSQSSRSQCIINIRSSPKVIEGARKETKLGEAVLTIVDLAGAEREKKTGNQGVRFNESNFINNTSMVFGLCLRALLEHQKNPKKTLQKHYHNSLLTRYLKDYLEAKGRMVMVLNVSPGEENYVDTAFVLRQASPYVNIKFTPPEEFPVLNQQKRSSGILPKGILPKRRKYSHSSTEEINHGKDLSKQQSLLTGAVTQDKVTSEDPDAYVKERNSCVSLSSGTTAERRKESISIKDSSSLLIFTEEELKERISFEVERALNQEGKESHERLMAVYTEALSNILKDHEIKVKMMEDQSQELEINLEKERENSLKLSNEVQNLKERCSYFEERCTYLECENEQLKMNYTSRNIKTEIQSHCKESEATVILQAFGSQNNHMNSESVAVGESNENTLQVLESEGPIPMNNFQAGSDVPVAIVNEEQLCVMAKDKEIRNGNLGIESKCEHTGVSLISQGCHGQNNNTKNLDVDICENDANTVLAGRKACDPLVEDEQISVRLEAKEIIKEKLDQFLQIDGEISRQTLSGVTALEGSSADCLESVEIGTLERQNEIQACEDIGCFSDIESKRVNSEASPVVEGCGCQNAHANAEDMVISENNAKSILVLENETDKFVGNSQAIREATDPDRKEQTFIRVDEKELTKENMEKFIQTDEKLTKNNFPGNSTSESSSIQCFLNGQTSTLERRDGIPSSKDEVCLSGTKSNLEKGRMLASMLVKGKLEDTLSDINRNVVESPNRSKAVSDSYTTSEDEVGPIGQCLEELLGLSPNEIENGLWKGDNECKQRISALLERHGGILDLHLFKKSYSLQRSLCLRYCFSLICKKASNDKHWVSLSEDVDPKLRQNFFWAVVKAPTIGKAACHAQRGLQEEGLLKNPYQSSTRQGGPTQTDSQNLNSSPQKSFSYLEKEKENICSSVGTPRRKLLPASSMLLTGMEDVTVEDDIPKDIDRSIRKSSIAERMVGTRGRKSLARMLTNIQRSF